MNKGFPYISKLRFKDYAFLALVAIELLMSFTFLGYLHVAPISITFAFIPVVIAARFLGTWQAVAIGAIFGLSSMFKASAYYVLPLDRIFSPVDSPSPIASILLSVGTRMLFGLLMWLIFHVLRGRKHFRLWTDLLCLLAPKFHGLLVYTALGLFFPEFGYSANNTLVLSISDIAASVLCLLAVELVQWIWHLAPIRDFYAYVEKAEAGPSQDRKTPILWGIFMLSMLLAGSASTIYFSQRMSYMLQTHGLNISADIDHDLTHLQIQFLIAMLAIYFIVALSMLLVYKYLAYKEYLGGLDGLTGIMGRKMFLDHCDLLQKKTALSGQDGWFLYIDIDYFKMINDTLGHPVGDTVLKSVAAILERNFGEWGCAGRLGGDEFAVILDKTVTEKDMKKHLEQFQVDISGILPAPKRVTGSIGACRFRYPQDMQEVYAQTDKLLYQAKRNGRTCYVIGNFTVS